MTLPDLYPAGCEAGKAALSLNSGHKKTPIIADRGYHFVRATGKPAQAPVALRITPKPNFGAIRYEFSW